MLETLLGGVLGGVLRVVPEILKWLDRKGERDHELRMTDKQIELEKARATSALQQAEIKAKAAVDAVSLSTLREAIKAQGAVTTGFASLLSSSVRPVITYFFFGIWAAIKLGAFVEATKAGMPTLQAFTAIWTESDQTLWAGIVNFWFLGRVFDKTLGR
jgi:hypothetical protein